MAEIDFQPDSSVPSDKIDFQSDSSLDLRPDKIDFHPDEPSKVGEFTSLWSRIKGSINRNMETIGSSRVEQAKTTLEDLDQPVINFSPKLFQLPAPFNILLPDVNREVSQHVAGIASGLTSGQGGMIAAGAAVAPEIALPILTGVAAKGAGEAAGRMSAELEQGNVAKAAGESVDVAANFAMAMPGLLGIPRPEAVRPIPVKPSAEVEPPPLPETSQVATPSVESTPKVEAQIPQESNPPVVLEASPSGEIAPSGDLPSKVTRPPRDYQIQNRINSGQWNFYFGRLGEAAKQAWTRMALDEMKMRESIGRDVTQYVDLPLQQLPKALKVDGAKAFTEILDGHTIDEIRSKWADKPDGELVIKAAESVKGRLEEIRNTIIETKRDSYRGYLSSKNATELGDIAESSLGERPPTNVPKEDIVDRLVTSEFPDDWGIADGSYFPHIFSGSWKIATEDGSFVVRAETVAEAKIGLRELVASNPELQDKSFTISSDIVLPADLIRLGDKQFFRQLNKIAKALEVPRSEVADAQRGVLGRKSSKQKFFGNLLKREGAKNYETGFKKSMTSYLYGFHRWKILSKMQREVTPLIEKVRAEKRENAAKRLEIIRDNLWGKPTDATVEFDNLLNQIPIIRDHVKPLALDRWTRAFRSAMASATLSTARFVVMNRFQPLQGLYPLLGERLVTKAKLLQHSDEGRALLDRYGVTFDVGQFGELGIPGKIAHFRERITGERSNQELSFLAMYLHGRETGLSPRAAADYGKLRGQLMTQFTPLIADTPQFMEGPIASTVFQYKRFEIKQAELIAMMAQDKNVPGLVRWIVAMSAAGGAVYWLKQSWQDNPGDVKKLRDGLEKKFGETGADYVLYGLPGFLGVDMSGSLVMGDAPFGDTIYEKVGRTAFGPGPSLAVRIGEVATKKSREPQTGLDRLVNVLRTIPTFKPIAELIESDHEDLRTPDGEIAYKRRLSDAILALGAFRSANESNLRIAINGLYELQKERLEAKNAAWVAEQSGNDQDAVSLIDKFNQRWPDMAISESEFIRYRKYRRSREGETDIQRAAGKEDQMIPEEQRK